MKRVKSSTVIVTITFLAMVGLMFLPASASAWWDFWDHYRAKAVTYSSPADFDLYFWMEKFQGGQPGKPGNVLFATGEGFTFQNATLLKVEPTSNPGEYKSTYVGGELFLNPAGPWLKKGKLRATDVTAINVSSYSPTSPPFTNLKYELKFSGVFDNDTDLCFDVTADYNGAPGFGLDPANPIYQKGDPTTGTFTATIIIKPCW